MRGFAPPDQCLPAASIPVRRPDPPAHRRPPTAPRDSPGRPSCFAQPAFRVTCVGLMRRTLHLRVLSKACWVEGESNKSRTAKPRYINNIDLTPCFSPHPLKETFVAKGVVKGSVEVRRSRLNLHPEESLISGWFNTVRIRCAFHVTPRVTDGVQDLEDAIRPRNLNVSFN
jgi:hypothetical protein